jgi:elongation factor G
VIGEVNKRKGLILDSETKEGYTLVVAEVPLNDMFGFSATLRASTQVTRDPLWCIDAD